MEFPLAEYQQRLSRTRLLMEEYNLDALMVTGDYAVSPNYRYLSGHLPRDYQANSARPHVLLYTREGGAAICVYYFSEATARQSWVENVHVYTQPFGHTDVLTLFEKLGFSRGRVGAELGLDQRMMIPFGDYERIRNALPAVEWVDAAPLIWRLRMIKSPTEVACIKEACRINGHGLARAYKSAAIGMTERQIYELYVRSLIEEGASCPPHTQMTISSSARYRGKGLITAFSGPTNEPLQQGDLVFIDSGVVHKGYWGEFGRTAVMGSPSADQLRWHESVGEIVRGVIRELRPGISCSQVMQTSLGLYKEAGLDPKQYETYVGYPYFHLCHGLGLNSSEHPYVRLPDETVIAPGMVFSVEAYLRGPDMQYAAEEAVVITDSGCELLTESDSNLYVIG